MKHIHTPARISVIIPTLNESSHIEKTIVSVKQCPDVQVIVVDGGSTDKTLEIAQRYGVQVVHSQPCRGLQLRVGVDLAQAEVLLFLHADTCLPMDYDRQVRKILSIPKTVAGAFRLAFDHASFSLRVIAWGANIRSCLRDLPYGDQAIFLKRKTYDQIGGIKPIAIMEDYDFVQRLRRKGRIHISSESVITSPRKYLEQGLWQTVLKHQKMIRSWQTPDSDHILLTPGPSPTK